MEGFPSRGYRGSVLSVANWDGNTLHLRGNMEGSTWGSSKHKFLRFIVGRHDLPFYYDEEVEVHRSFLEALLKDNDYAGWKTGKVPPVSVCLRKGEVEFNNAEGEKTFPRRDELELPIARTEYIKFFLTPGLGLKKDAQGMEHAVQRGEGAGIQNAACSIRARGDRPRSRPSSRLGRQLCFSTTRELGPGSVPDSATFHSRWQGSTLHRLVWRRSPRHERLVADQHASSQHRSPYHRPYLPRLEYLSTDFQQVQSGVIYDCDVELWLTNVVVEKGGWLMLQVSSEDTEPGVGLFKHNSPIDRYVQIVSSLSFPY